MLDTVTVSELVARLQEIARTYPDADVLMAYNPAWPIQATLRGVVTSAEVFDNDPNAEPVLVWLVEGGLVLDDPAAPETVFTKASI